jgi:hypothetical protein
MPFVVIYTDKNLSVVENYTVVMHTFVILLVGIYDL